MKVAVALCSYNGARYLGAQLESIRGQSRPVDRVVISDDGSTDATVTIASQFARNWQVRPEVLRSEVQLGPTRNFERAVERCADADVILYCDQDDVWDPGKVEAVLRAAAAAPDAACIIHDAELADEGLNPLGVRLWEALDFRPTGGSMTDSEVAEHLLRRTIAFGNTMAFRTTLLKHALPFPASFGHDNWVALVAAATSRVALVSRPLIRYRQHGSQVSGGAPTAPGLRLTAARVGPRTPTARSFYEAAGRLAACDDGGTHPHPFVLSEVRRKARHLEVRAQLPATLIGRVSAVAAEVMNGRYHRYSNGLRSAASDIFVGPRTDLL